MSVLLSVLFGLAAMISFGLNNYFGPLASRRIGAYEASALSRAFALGIFFIVFVLFFLQVPNISAYTAVLLLVTATAELIGTVAFYKGAKLGRISIIAPISNSSSVITIILGLIFLNAPLSGNDYIGVAMIITGTILSSFKLKDIRALNISKAATGIGLGFVGMLGWGTGLFTTILLVRQIGWFFPAFLVSFVMVIFFGIFYRSSRIKYVAPRSEWPMLLFLGITLATGLFAYNIGVTTSDPLIVAPILAAAPALTVALAFVKLKEKAEPGNIAGIALILLGIIVLAL